MAMSFNFVLTGGKGNFVANSDNKETKGISNNNSNIEQPTLLTSTDINCVAEVLDGFDGKDMAGTFDMSKMTPEMIAAAETIGSVAANTETAGSIAANIETAGTVASAAETAGSIAFDGGGGFDGGSDSGFCSFG